MIIELITNMPIDLLETIFKLRKRKAYIGFDDDVSTFQYEAAYHSEIGIPVFKDIEYKPINKYELSKELIFYNILTSDNPWIENRINGKFSLDDIMNVVCSVNNVDINFVTKRTRKRKNLTPRQEFYYIAMYYSKATTSEIGWYGGGYDHTTVLHGAKVIKDLLDSPGSSQIKENILYIYDRLGIAAERGRLLKRSGIQRSIKS